MSIKTYSAYGTDRVWCDDIKAYVNKDHAIKLKGFTNYRLLREGRNGIGYIMYEDYGFTIVSTFKMKDKSYCSSYYFNGKPTPEEVEHTLFKNARHVSSITKKIAEPFSVIYRYGILTMDEWNERYEPNDDFSRHKTKDKALLSMISCIEESDGNEVKSSNSYRALYKAQREIVKLRKFIARKITKWPVVEVYAIWPNYDPETLLVNTKDYDAMEPLVYTYNKFTSKEEMNNYPM